MLNAHVRKPVQSLYKQEHETHISAISIAMDSKPMRMPRKCSRVGAPAYATASSGTGA